MRELIADGHPLRETQVAHNGGVPDRTEKTEYVYELGLVDHSLRDHG